MEHVSLERVVDAPVFSYPVYLIFARAMHTTELTQACEFLRSAVEKAQWGEW